MVHLYQKGTELEIRGFMCNVQKINPRRFHGELPEGWFFSPEEAHEEVKAEAKEEPEAKETEDKKSSEVLDVDDMCNHEIRKEAKEAGIESWKTSRIETLKDKLKA